MDLPSPLTATLAPALRAVFARELLPARARWWLAAAGMRDWLAVLGSRLRPHLGEQSRPVVAELAGEMFHRRHAALCAEHPRVAAGGRQMRAVALLTAALYRLPPGGRGGWILGAVGGPPRGAAEWLRAARLLAPLDAEARWREVAAHLGELLIVSTERLPGRLPAARKVLGDICFEAGGAYARRMRRTLGLEARPVDAPAVALEILRTSEYVFRVNPEHWGETDAASGTGYLEGTACPWWDRPGWHAGHCGIFGQFQNGVCAELGLKYRLERTIPKHGGSTCKITVEPIPASALARRAQRGEASAH
jgi:hypothetical protein